MCGIRQLLGDCLCRSETDPSIIIHSICHTDTCRRRGLDDGNLFLCSSRNLRRKALMKKLLLRVMEERDASGFSDGLVGGCHALLGLQPPKFSLSLTLVVRN